MPKSRPRRRLGGDTGAETVSLAVLFPIAIVLILGGVQAGLYWDARNVLAAAAQAGANTGRVLHATTDDATSAATSFVTRSGTRRISHPAVSAERTADTVTVTVTGTAQKIIPIPGIEFRISMGATAPVERWTAPGRQP